MSCKSNCRKLFPRYPFLLILLLSAPLAVAGQSPSTGPTVGRLTNEGTVEANASSIRTPAQWPNLDVLDNYSNPSGTTCGIDGAATTGTEKAKLNRLKNRYRLPTSGDFEEVTFDDLLLLPHGELNSQNVIVNYPRSGDSNNRRAVSLVGYVQDVFAAGCRRYPSGGGGESCNCNTTVKRQCDAHINLVLDPFNDGQDGRGVVVVEVTERARRLVADGLLTTNIGNDWSTQTLRARLLGRWVKFSGWLYFDADHFDQAWVIDQDNTSGRNNFRETAWEIHPVMGIEVVQAPSPFINLGGLETLSVRPPPAPTAESSRPPSAGATKEQIIRRIEALEREIKALKEDVQRLPQ